MPDSAVLCDHRASRSAPSLSPLPILHFPAHRRFGPAFAVEPTLLADVDVWDVDQLVARGVELVHLHGGFDEVAPTVMWNWCEQLTAVGIRLAVTVHDLDNPRLADQLQHHERLRALIHHAHTLFTLTNSANTELVRRWGRPATVVPHPRMATEELRATVCHRPAVDRPALVWLGACRANVDVDAVVDLIEHCDQPIEVVARLDGWDGLTDSHRERLVDAVCRSRQGELVITGRPDDTQLVELIAHRRALVLPHRWGTHSSLVQLARELGVPTIVPAVGCHADQGAIVGPASQLAELLATVAYRAPALDPGLT
jgi:beta-1,4-mannosyltransferase